MGTPAAAADPLQAAMTLLTNTMVTFAGSQSHFLHAAVAADQNISQSLATPLLYSEVLEAKAIDNTVDDRHRNGLRASHRDLRESMPHDYVTSSTRATPITIQLILVTSPTGVEATTKPLKSAQTTFPHGTETVAAPF